MSASNCRQKALLAPPPEARTRVAAHAQRLDDVQAIALAVGDAFDHRADQIRARVAGGEADPAAARGGVQVGGALAHQVRQPEQALRAGRRLRGFGGERVVLRSGRQLVAEPLQAQTGALRHAHHVPLVAHRVAKGVDAAGGIVRHLLHVGEHHAGGAQRAGNDARLDNAIAHGARCLVAAAAHHRRAGLKSGEFRHLRRDLAA